MTETLWVPLDDISEELARLAHYIDEAKVLLRQSEGAGKKMDFIAQEMQRETNTIGSKVQDKEVAGAVIALKSKVEKIREQALQSVLTFAKEIGLHTVHTIPSPVAGGEGNLEYLVHLKNN